MPQRVVSAVDKLANGAVELWIWITVGLIAIIAFFGRRLTRKWDQVVDSHMPEQEIKDKFKSILSDIKASEEKIRREHSGLVVGLKVEQKQIAASVDKVHERLDTLYQLLLQKD